MGHIGFDRIEATESQGVRSHAYAHYLHHKYFEVNDGDGLVPLDKLFGNRHDGTSAGEARMNERYQRRKAKANAKAPTGCWQRGRPPETSRYYTTDSCRYGFVSLQRKLVMPATETVVEIGARKP